MNYDRFFQLIDRAHYVAWCAVISFCGLIVSAVFLVIVRVDEKLYALYLLVGFAAAFIVLILLYYWLLGRIAAMDYNRCPPRHSPTAARRYVHFKPPAVLAPKKDPS